jgi:hypothetical protein
MVAAAASLSPQLWLTAVAAAASICFNALPFCRNPAASVAGPVTAATLPGIEQLTALEDLQLFKCVLEPSCLLRLSTGLTSLDLKEVVLEPYEHVNEDALGATQLLQVLARLTALQTLRIFSIGGDLPQELSLFSALTASSNLQHLQLSGFVKSRAWTHMLPAGRMLPQLRTFTALASVFYEQQDYDVFAQSPADVSRIVSSCPGLQEVCYRPWPGHDACIDPLQSLTALTKLHICSTQRDAVCSLAALTRLQDLEVSVVPDRVRLDMTDVMKHKHLVPLTALTALTRLATSLDPDGSRGHWLEWYEEHQVPEQAAIEFTLQDKVRVYVCCRFQGP